MYKGVSALNYYVEKNTSCYVLNLVIETLLTTKEKQASLPWLPSVDWYGWIVVSVKKIDGLVTLLWRLFSFVIGLSVVLGLKKYFPEKLLQARKYTQNKVLKDLKQYKTAID